MISASRSVPELPPGVNRIKLLFLRHRRRGKISCGLHYKPITIITDNSSIVDKLETSLINDARFVIYDCHMFIVQATGV